MALNIDLITIFIQIMWTALICGVNFFLSLTYEPLTYEYGMPSMTYFTLFSIFLFKDFIYRMEIKICRIII